MGLELIISQREFEKIPIKVCLNLRSRKLRIDNHEIYIGGFINVIGPQERRDKWLLSIVYPRIKSIFAKKYAEKISSSFNMKIEIKENCDQQEVYVLDLYFPRNFYIANATYNIQ